MCRPSFHLLLLARALFSLLSVMTQLDAILLAAGDSSLGLTSRLSHLGASSLARAMRTTYPQQVRLLMAHSDRYAVH
jgi:hypothetical protein